jgi:hypothetical protein
MVASDARLDLHTQVEKSGFEGYPGAAHPKITYRRRPPGWLQQIISFRSLLCRLIHNVSSMLPETLSSQDYLTVQMSTFKQK